MQPSVPTSSSWRRCPCLSIDMARKLAVFGLVFALTELSAAYLPLSALWLAAAIFVAAGIWPSIRRESVRVIAVPLMAAVVLGLGCSTLYRWFVVRPAEALSGRTAEIVATVQTDAQTSYREEMLSATLHITEMDGEPADLYASCGAFPGARAGEIFSARVSLEALEEDAYRMNRYADGVYLNAEYLDGYDRENDKVKLKIIHTYGVVEQSRNLAERLMLSEEDTSLAMIIALLHDIGRFEQLKRYDSFEPATMDHAAYGVKVLFEEGMIRRFVACDVWDDIIRTAIAKHSDFILEGIDEERTLFHAKLIRDADKLDNCRVKLVDDLETFMGATAAEIGAQRISPKVKEDALAGRSIYSPDRETLMDYWVSYLAYFYDLNFRESLDIVEENDYVRRIFDRVPYTEPGTRQTMEKLREKLVTYVREGVK